MNTDAPRWLLAIVGAIVLAIITEEFPKVGGGLLLAIVLGMLLTATKKGMV